jgi:glycosyltransferase involved in cell wall biosynthesis
MKPKDLTIVVPTKNESRNITGFLESIPSDVDLIVVDASDDETTEIIARTRPERTSILTCPGNIATARQRGAETARTEWLLFTDADLIFDPAYFQNLARVEPDPLEGGIAGAKSSRTRYRTYFRLFNTWLRLLCRLGIPAATGSNMLVRRKALLEAGGFDSSLDCNEDSYLMWRVGRLGYQVPFRGDLRVYESDHRRLDRGMVRKSLHSIVRCFLLFYNILPSHVRNNNWGYWEEGAKKRELKTETRRSGQS